MQDEFELARELDEQMRQEYQENSIQSAADTLLPGRDDPPENIYDTQRAIGPQDDVLPRFEEAGGPAEEIEPAAPETEEKEAPPVSQEELNTLVSKVTEFGADESVLGKERLLEAFREAETSEAKGGSYVEGFTSAVQRMMGIQHDPDPVEQQPVEEASRPEESSEAKERFQHHKERYEAQFETADPWPRDTVTAYHRMAMTYNAYIAGEKIGGMEVSKVDVFLSGVRFYQSNIFETAIIRSLQFAGNLFKEKYAEDKIETEQNATETAQVKPDKLKDDMGAFDHGDATAVSKDDIQTIRKNIKEYGFDYGIDTTRGLDYNSTDNVRIFRATDVIGRIDAGMGKTIPISGVRMVDIDGNRALVTPDGKVVHENTRFQAGDGFKPEDFARIEYRCDVFETRTMREQISQMAANRGVSVESIKAEYAQKAMETYAERIEKTMLGEADRLERQTIPEAREELHSMKEDFSKLERIEASLKPDGVDAQRGLSSSDVSSLKSSLQNGMEILETRISAMEGRVELLRDTHAQIDTSGIKDRFERAANAEEQAVGRGGRIEYISSDVERRLSDVIDVGTERVLGDVERFNSVNPEQHITYDADTGELYNHFGVSDSGNFNPEYATVETKELPADNTEAIRDYVSEHAEADFDAFKEFLERPEEKGDAVEQEEAAEETGGVSQEQAPAEEAAVTEAQTNAVENEETEAKVAVAHDEDANAPDETGVPQESAQEASEPSKSDYAEKIRELFSDYIGDSEGTVSLEDDIQNPIVDLTAESGKSDFREAMDILSDMVKGMDQIAPEQLNRISELVHAVADISEVPADAIDAFQDSIQGADFAEDLIAELGKPELTTAETEIGAEAQVSIGGEQLSVGPEGLYDAVSGEASGGFQNDDAANQYLDKTESALYDKPIDTESGHNDVEAENPGEQKKMDTLADALEEIGDSGAVSAEENAADGLSGVEAGTEAAGAEGLEGVEAAGSAAAAEGAVEAGAAAALL